ncbi:hypothetical protein [Maridesulfovibrio sp.]|uniref:hypothetical protein n=1 Tax=Maridesulfovibrio sp. TaxID=2795000 RepID=UPI0029C9D974|nr:hypothetical protein [Maridesulfovibrio sp.]
MAEVSFLIRDDGVVFPFDERTAGRKDMRLMSKAEMERYRTSLKPDGKKFVADPSAASAAELVESDLAINLYNGEYLESTPENLKTPGVIVLTAKQAEIAQAVKDELDKEEAEDVQSAADNSDNLESMTVMQLRSHAKARFNLDMPNTIKKAEAIAIIRAKTGV